MATLALSRILRNPFDDTYIVTLNRYLLLERSSRTMQLASKIEKHRHTKNQALNGRTPFLNCKAIAEHDAQVFHRQMTFFPDATLFISLQRI